MRSFASNCIKLPYPLTRSAGFNLRRVRTTNASSSSRAQAPSNDPPTGKVGDTVPQAREKTCAMRKLGRRGANNPLSLSGARTRFVQHFISAMKEGLRHIEQETFEETIEQIVAQNERYHREAYLFVRDSLRRTIETAIKSGHPSEVDAADVLDGFRSLALKQFGPMTKFVLEEWGIHTCHDFGEILFNMADVGFLANSAKGCQTAFDDGFDFDEAFCKPFLPHHGLIKSGFDQR